MQSSIIAEPARNSAGQRDGTRHHEPMEAPTDDNGNFCSLAFKLWSDPFVGKLVFFRVYSGTLSKGDTVYIRARTNANAFRG